MITQRRKFRQEICNTRWGDVSYKEGISLLLIGSYYPKWAKYRGCLWNKEILHMLTAILKNRFGLDVIIPSKLLKYKNSWNWVFVDDRVILESAFFFFLPSSSFIMPAWGRMKDPNLLELPKSTYYGPIWTLIILRKNYILVAFIINWFRIMAEKTHVM